MTNTPNSSSERPSLSDRLVLDKLMLHESEVGRNPESSTTDLSHADLSRIDLSGRDLRRTILTRVDFGDQPLIMTDLRDSVLSYTKLDRASGLTIHQLGGSDLTGSYLPEHFDIDSIVDTLDSRLKTTQRIMILLLTTCVYCWIVFASTSDANLLTNSTSTALPFVGVHVHPRGFFVGVTVGLALLQFFALLALLRSADVVAALPAVLRDGRSFNEKLSSWLFVGYFDSLLPMLRHDVTLWGKIQRWLVNLLLFGATPFTILWAANRYECTHQRFGEIIQMLSFCACIHVALNGYVLLRRRIVRDRNLESSESGSWRKVIQAVRKRLYPYFAAGLMAAVYFALWPYFHNREMDDLRSVRDIPALEYGTLIGTGSAPNLINAEVSRKPEQWNGGRDELIHVVGAQLRGAYLRRSTAQGAFLAKANLYDADLVGSDLTDADLRYADLSHANLRNAILIRANLEGAKLDSADLRGSVVVETNALMASMKWMDVRGTDLSLSRVEEAILRETTFDSTTIFPVGMQIQR